MSTAVAAQAGPIAGRTAIFHGRSRLLVAAVVVAGPLLQVVEFLAARPPDASAARVAYWTAHPTATGVSMAVGVLAIPFLLGGIAAFVALTRVASPLLAWVAGALMISAMTGLAVVHGYELAAYALAREGRASAAAAVLSANDLGVTGPVVFLMFLGAAAAGTALLAIAVWRSPLVPRIVAPLILAFALIDFVLGRPIVSHVVNLAGFAIVGAAIAAGYVRGSGAEPAAVAADGQVDTEVQTDLSSGRAA
jgi:hypothetical protein